MGIAPLLLAKLAGEIRRTHRKGLHTLVLLGSGISMGPGAEIPSLRSQYEVLLKLERLSKKDEEGLHRQLQQEEQEELRGRADEVFAKSIERAEPVSARFREFRADDRVWRPFINGDPSFDWKGMKKIIEAAKPTRAHEALARLARMYSLICASTNFDGLMHQSLIQELPGRVGFCTDARELETALVPYPSQEEVKLLIKLRGDALFYECRAPFCRQRPRVFHIYRRHEIQRADELRCPFCGNREVEMNMSLPGDREKEKANEELLRVVLERLMPGIRVIVVVGFSGVWDGEIKRFFEEVTERPVDKRARPSIAVYDININRTSLFSETEMPYTWIEGSADDCLIKLEAILNKGEEETHCFRITETDWTPKGVNIPRVNFISNPLALRIENKLSEFLLNEQTILDSPEWKKLGVAHQLGLDSFFLETANGEHTRKVHSFFVAAIATKIAMKLLGVERWPAEVGAAVPLIRLAALFHDVGHLPFGHLVEQMAEKIPGYEYSHDAVIRDSIENNDAVKKVLEGVWESEELCALIDGGVGINWIDAVINSPMDSEKFEYVTRDFGAIHDRRPNLALDVPLAIEPSYLLELELRDLLAGNMRIGKDPMKSLVLTERGFQSVVRLLEYRSMLYEKVYYSREFRLGEGFLKVVLVEFYDRAREYKKRRMDVASKVVEEVGLQQALTQFFLEAWDELDTRHGKENIEGYVVSRMIAGFPQPRRGEYEAFWEKLKEEKARLAEFSEERCYMEYVISFGDERVVGAGDRKPSKAVPEQLVEEFKRLNGNKFLGFYDVIRLKAPLAWAGAQARRRMIWVEGTRRLEPLEERLGRDLPNLVNAAERAVVRMFWASDEGRDGIEGIESRLLNYLERRKVDGSVVEVIRVKSYGERYGR